MQNVHILHQLEKKELAKAFLKAAIFHSQRPGEIVLMNQYGINIAKNAELAVTAGSFASCLLYTSDAADES